MKKFEVAFIINQNSTMTLSVQTIYAEWFYSENHSVIFFKWDKGNKERIAVYNNVSYVREIGDK